MFQEFIHFAIGDITFNGIIYAAFVIPAFIAFWMILKKQVQHLRIQPQQKAKWKHILHDAGHSFSTILVFAIIDYALYLLERNGHTQIYYDINEYGIIWFIASILIMMVLHDTYFYWTHRAMHHPWLYKYFHKVHHNSTDPSPFTSFAFHPLEAIVENGVTFIFAFIMPVNFTALIIWQLLQMFFNVVGHLGYEVYPSWWTKNPILKWKTPSTHHNMHHELFNGNYALYFTWWDKWMGTEFRNYEARYLQIFDKKTEPNDGWYKLEVAQILDEPNDAFSIYFHNVPSVFHTFRAGQHITLRVRMEGQTYFRTFSLSASPNSNICRLTIKRIPGGKVTNWLYHNILPGSQLEATVPNGQFYVEPEPDTQKHYIMIAGGSGITPIYSMIGHILPIETKSKITLLYANRNSETIIFKKDLDDLCRQYPKQLNVIHFISHDKASDNYKQGFINKNVLAEIINQSQDPTKLHFYLCGPERMTNQLIADLQTLKISPQQIHQELFVAPAVAPSISSKAAQVKVKLEGKEYAFSVEENNTVLQSALQQHIPMPFSCQSGLCGMCKMKCTEGKMKLLNNQILTEAELKQGYVLTCQAIAETEEIYLQK